MSSLLTRISPEDIQVILKEFAWDVIILSDTYMMLKYLGMNEDLFYIYIKTKATKNQIIFTGVFPQTLSKEEETAMLHVCNIMNNGFTLGSIKLDFEEKQFTYRLGMFKTPYTQFDFLFIEYLIYVCNVLECVNRLIEGVRIKGLNDYTSIFDLAVIIEDKWEEQKSTQTWSFRNLKQ